MLLMVVTSLELGNFRTRATVAVYALIWRLLNVFPTGYLLY